MFVYFMFTNNCLLFTAVLRTISAKTIIYSNFLGILNKIPFFGYALPFLDLCGTKICVAFCVNTSFSFLFFSNRYCPRFASHAHIVQILLCATGYDCGPVYSELQRDYLYCMLQL